MISTVIVIYSNDRFSISHIQPLIQEWHSSYTDASQWHEPSVCECRHISQLIMCSEVWEMWVLCMWQNLMLIFANHCGILQEAHTCTHHPNSILHHSDWKFTSELKMAINPVMHRNTKRHTPIVWAVFIWSCAACLCCLLYINTRAHRKTHSPTLNEQVTHSWCNLAVQFCSAVCRHICSGKSTPSQTE